MASKERGFYRVCLVNRQTGNEVLVEVPAKRVEVIPLRRDRAGIIEVPKQVRVKFSGRVNDDWEMVDVEYSIFFE